MNIYIYVYKGNYSPSPQFICPMWHGKFTWSFHLELGFHKYIHMNIYIYIYAWKLQGINLCLEISSCETGPALMHSNQTYNMCISWVPLVCDVVDWFYLRHEAMADQAIRCHPLPLLAVTCLESSATVASARCIVRSLGSVYSTGTGHKAQGIIYRLYFLSISQYIIIYIYNLIYGICPRHRYIHTYIYIYDLHIIH